jgi:hypothetical protein
VVSTRSSVTERPNHGNRAALLALRKLEVSNEANLGTPITLAIPGYAISEKPRGGRGNGCSRRRQARPEPDLAERVPVEAGSRAGTRPPAG